MQRRSLAITLMCSISLAMLLNGCGSSNKAGTGTLADTPKVDESSCRICHATTVEPVTGSNILQDFLVSKHNLFINSHYPDGVGCQGCHGGGAQHNGVGPIPYTNPDTAGQCYTCHTNYLNTVHQNALQPASDAVSPAMYVSKMYQNSCTSCHDPHKADKGIGQEHTDWAESGHGNVNGAAWATEDFKENSSCIRCHTATGFKDYIKSGFTTLPSTSWVTTGDTTRQVLACDACHSSYNFKNSVRSAAQFTAPYKVAWKLPNASTSNICISCHTGRANNSDINAITNFSNVSFKNSHYMAAAGLMYMSTGYTGFVPGTTVIGTTTYEKTLTIDSTSDPVNGIVGGVSSTHRKLGTTAINNDSHNTSFFIAGNLDSNGPCVACHMNGVSASSPKRNSSHTLSINSEAFTQVCINCHTSEAGTNLTGANFNQLFLTPQKEVFEAALTLAKTLLLQNYNIKYVESAYPYFFDMTKDSTGKTGVTDWTRSGALNAAQAKNLMGACFNINLLTREPGAYVHARSYVRRLIYDSIDFLDDKTINLSTGATAIATTPSIYGKGTKAYTSNTLTTLDTGTTEAMVYLLGFSRSTGAWNTPERP